MSILREKRDGFTFWGLFLATVVSRIPFHSRVLYHWDSVNFAFGMRDFDVLAEQPHPPGYILYVWLSRLVDVIFRDPQTTMVSIAIVASGLAVGSLYLLGREIWDRRTGLIAALLLASSPLFWFYGEIALPHTLDAFLVILSVGLLYRAYRGESRFLWPAVTVLAITGGVRPQTLVFLLPLTIVVAWRSGWQRLFAAGAVGAIICLAWFVPLVASCGGVEPYLRKSQEFFGWFQQDTALLGPAGISGLLFNTRRIGMYTLYGMAAGLIPAAAWPLARVTRRSGSLQRERWVFLGLWIAPPLLFYALVHMGQQGLTFVYLPALLLLAARGLTWLGRRRWLAVVTVALVLANAVLFCLGPEYVAGQRLLTRTALVNTDRYYAGRFNAIRETFAPQQAAVISVRWHHLEYYLPTYPLLRLNTGLPGRPRAVYAYRWPGEEGLTPADMGFVMNEDQETMVILFDAEIVTSAPLAGSIPLTGGDSLRVLQVGADQRLRYRDGVLEVVDS